jgi:hypothetical protein
MRAICTESVEMAGKNIRIVLASGYRVKAKRIMLMLSGIPYFSRKIKESA